LIKSSIFIKLVALSYGSRRREEKDAPKEGEPEKQENVLFIDMGHSFFSAKVVAFTKNKLKVHKTNSLTKVSKYTSFLKVLSSVSDRSAGARAFDYNLVNHFAAEIKVAFS